MVIRASTEYKTESSQSIETADQKSAASAIHLIVSAYLVDTLLPAGSPTDFKYSIVSDGMHSFSSKI